MRFISIVNKKTKQVFKEVTGREAPFAFVVYWPWFYKDWLGLTICFIIFTKKPGDVPHLCHELVHVDRVFNLLSLAHLN